jgi:hypothetical protein
MGVWPVRYRHTDASVNRIVKVKQPVYTIIKNIGCPDTWLSCLKYPGSLIPVGQIAGYIHIVAVVVAGRVQVVFSGME